MGTKVSTRCMRYDALMRHSIRVEELMRIGIISKFKRVLPLEKMPFEIISIGVECEYFILNKKGIPVPGFNRFRDLDIDPELLKCSLERKSKRFFNMDTTLDEVVNHFINLDDPVVERARDLGCVLTNSGTPSGFDGRKIRDTDISDNDRYVSLKHTLDGFGTNEFEISFVDRIRKRRGMVYEGGAASVQINLKVPHEYVHAYRDAAEIVQSILAHATASGPIIESRMSTEDSIRLKTMADSVYGFSKEEKEKGRPGRMRVIRSMLTQPLNGNLPVDFELYTVLQTMGIPEPTARYAAHVLTEGSLLVTENQLLRGVRNNIEPTIWPSAKLKYDTLMDNQGIGLEVRLLENMGNPRDNAALVISAMAMIQGVAEDIYHGNVTALKVEQIVRNISTSASGNEDKFLYYPSATGARFGSLRQAFEYLAQKSIPVLKKYKHKSIGKILNPVISKAGLRYVKRKLRTRVHEPNLAQRKRETCIELQKGTEYGEKLIPRTLSRLTREYAVK